MDLPILAKMGKCGVGYFGCVEEIKNFWGNKQVIQCNGYIITNVFAINKYMLIETKKNTELWDNNYLINFQSFLQKG